MARPLVEVCVASLTESQHAETSGADRIELNCGLQLGGLTPSAGLTERVLAGCNLPVVAMVRPRPGGFCYDRDDWETLVASSRWMIDRKVHGLAFGCLTADRKIDTSRVAQIRQLDADTSLVFHRAFDLVADWKLAVDQLIDLGVQRIMTSGHVASVPQGLDRIREIIEYADRGIEIIPAGGITPANVLEVVSKTGCDQVHGTFSQPVVDAGYLEAPIRFAENDGLRRSDPETIGHVVETLRTGTPTSE